MCYFDGTTVFECEKSEGWFTVSANDLELRKCLETKVDIFKTS
jgi:ATP-dependent Lon protease